MFSLCQKFVVFVVVLFSVWRVNANVFMLVFYLTMRRHDFARTYAFFCERVCVVERTSERASKWAREQAREREKVRVIMRAFKRNKWETIEATVAHWQSAIGLANTKAATSYFVELNILRGPNIESNLFFYIYHVVCYCVYMSLFICSLLFFFLFGCCCGCFSVISLSGCLIHTSFCRPLPVHRRDIVSLFDTRYEHRFLLLLLCWNFFVVGFRWLDLSFDLTHCNCFTWFEHLLTSLFV